MELIELSHAVQNRAVEMCRDQEGRLSLSRLVHVYVGASAEALIDFGDVFEESSFSVRRMVRDIAPNMDVMATNMYPMPGPLELDIEFEMGRVLSRFYLDGSYGCARSFVTVVEGLIGGLCNRHGDGIVETVERVHNIAALLDLAVIMEHATHQLCDDLIEINIARQGWSLGDCIQGLSALSGRRLAMCKETGPLCNIMDLTRIMGAEALRLGVKADFDMARGLAANDSASSLPMGLIGALEPMCMETLNRYHLSRTVDQAAILSKAAGRMIAVASSGDMPEIEAVVARPIALSAMTNAYKKFSV